LYYQPPYRNLRSKPNVIRVSGEGKVTIQPDHVEIRLGVSTNNRNLAQAQEENARAISNIKKTLIQMGISEKQIKTIDYSIYPQYDFVEGKQVFKFYKVEHMLLIHVLDISQAGPVVDAAVNQGANLVSGIRFGTSNYDQYYKQALSLAVIDAGKKAGAIADTLNVQLSIAPLSIIENMPDLAVPYHAQTFVKGVTSTSFQPGTMDVVSSVTAEYAYVPM